MPDSYVTQTYGALGRRPCRLLSHADYPDLPHSFDQFFRATWQPDAAPSVTVHRDVFVVGERRQARLYDRDGYRIAGSDVPAMFPASEPALASVADRVDPASFEGCRTVDEPVVFQSVFFWHWGHFLLESCARLWAGLVAPELAGLPSLFAWPKKIDFAGEPFLSYLAAADVKWLHRGHGVTRLTECFAPDPTYASRTFTHAFQLKAPHRVADRLLKTIRRDDAPVYLSRSRVSALGGAHRVIDNEIEFEQRLAACGVHIAHMQEMTFVEQIEMMNGRRVFIGPWGSALHNTLFSLVGAEITTFVLMETERPTNFLLIDNIVGNAAHYLCVLLNAGVEGEVTHLNLDIETTLEYLRGCGVL